MIFTTGSELFIWGGGGSPLEKPQLPFKQNHRGRGQDTLRTSLLFSSGQQKPIVTRCNFSHQKEHMGGGLFIFDGLHVVQELHLFTYTSPRWLQPARRLLPFPRTLFKFIPLFPAQVEKAKEKLC